MKRKRNIPTSDIGWREKKNKKFIFIKLLLLFFLIALVFSILYLIFLVNSFGFTFSDKYRSANENLKEQTWLFIRVNNQDLDVALIEEIQIFFVSDNFQKIYKVNIGKDILLEDRMNIIVII